MTGEAAAASDVFAHDILPVIFGQDAPSAQPSLVLVVGQPGSGRARLARHLLSDNPDAVILNVDDLAAFHPEYLELTRRRPFDASAAMAPAIADWLSQGITHALLTRRSLILTSTVNDPTIAIGTAAVFADAGYATHIVVVAARRSESLLTTASQFHAARRMTLPARFVDVSTHRRGWIGTRALVRDVATDASLDHLTILDREGSLLFDARQGTDLSAAPSILDAHDRRPISTLAAVEWFAELRRVTEYVHDSRDHSAPIIDVLVELHELALNEVLPLIEVRQKSSFMIEQERRLTQELVELRRLLPARREPGSTTTGPAHVPPSVSPRGPSL